MSSYLPMLVKLLYYLNLGAPDQAELVVKKSENFHQSSYKEQKAELERLDSIIYRQVVTCSISGLILNLLKIARAHRIGFNLDELAFEHTCQVLVDANFFVLSIKMLSHWFPAVPSNGEKDVSKSKWLYPLQDPRELQFLSFCCSVSQEKRTDIPKSYRNRYTCSNLLRILQKMTKNKSHRIMTLLHWKSSFVLRRISKTAEKTCVHYALKLLKSQIPYLGKKWRTNSIIFNLDNMKIISMIYHQLQPRLCETYLTGDSDINAQDVQVVALI